MYFLWSREPLPPPPITPAGPWFAWFATAVLLWRCRKRISRAISYTCLPLKLLKHQQHQYQQQQRQRGPSLCVSRAGLRRPAARRDQLHAKRLSPKLIAAAIEEKQQQQQQQQKRPSQHRQVTFKEPVAISNESTARLNDATFQSLGLIDSGPPSSNTRYKNANPTNHPSIMKSGRLKRKASLSSLSRQHSLGRPRKQQQQQQQQQHKVTRASRKLTLNNSEYGVHICQQVYYRVTRSGRVYG